MRETKRLELVPLTQTQLSLWLQDIPKLEKELQTIYQGEPLTGFFHDYIASQIRTIDRDKENYLFHTFWLMIRKADRITVGSLAFKGLPNENGEIEIGYGLGKEFEHNGYMTEAVQELCKWGLEQESVHHIIAETDLDGFASQRILQRNGFQCYRLEESSWWRL